MIFSRLVGFVEQFLLQTKQVICEQKFKFCRCAPAPFAARCILIRNGEILPLPQFLL
jgi:hypothetical protein